MIVQSQPSPSAPEIADVFSINWEHVGPQLLKWLGEAGLNLVQIAIIVAISLVSAWLLRLVIRRVVLRVVRGAKSKARVDDTQALDRSPLAAVRLVQRTRTLGSILQNIVNITVVIVALVMIVNLVAPGILGSFALITAAIGAGLGFGAQNIVKDVLNGIFIVVEDQIGIGDVVDLGLATGIVEYVSVRVTHVRDVNGTLWYVRNGEILRIGNMSQGWSRVIVDVTLPADTDLDELMPVVNGAAQDLAREPKWRSRIVGRPEMWGLEEATSESLVLRVVMRTRSASRDDVAQELRLRLLRAVTAAGVEGGGVISVTLDTTAGALRVHGANPPKTRPSPVTPAPPSERSKWLPARKNQQQPPETNA